MSKRFEYQKIVMSPKIDEYSFRANDPFMFDIGPPVEMTMIFTPLEKFEKGGTTIHLYKIEWTENKGPWMQKVPYDLLP